MDFAFHSVVDRDSKVHFSAASLFFFFLTITWFGLHSVVHWDSKENEKRGKYLDVFMY